MLKTVDNGVSARFEVASSLEQLLQDGELSLHDALLKGFNIEAHGDYKKTVAKLLRQYPPLEKTLKLGGIALGLSSNLDLELNFKNAQKLKDHPLLGPYVNSTIN